MTRKDYQAIAAVLLEQGYHDAEGLRCGALTSYEYDAKQSATRQIAGCLALVFAKGNPRFDRDTFLKACGL